MTLRKRRYLIAAICLMVGIILCGLLLPQRLVIPVMGATEADWNHRTFWHPWGASGVHKGIDIFADEGTPVISASLGFVLFSGTIPEGGNVVSVLGPKWRIHYYAHLSRTTVHFGEFVRRGDRIGSVGSTGNARGKPPHLHYAIITQMPYVWRLRFERFGFDRMFYLNPHEELIRESRRRSADG